MRRNYLIVGFIFILLSSGLMYLGVQEQINRFGYPGSYPIFQNLAPGLRAFIFNMLFASLMACILGVVFWWKFKPTYYLEKTGEDARYAYLEVKEESPTLKKIKYSFLVLIIYFTYSLFPLSYTAVGQPTTVPFSAFIGAIIGVIGIILCATGFIRKVPKEPEKEQEERHEFEHI